MSKKNIPYLLTPILLALAFPPFNLYFLAFFALVPVLNETEKRSSFLKLFFSGFLFNLLLLYWLYPVLTGYGQMPQILAILSLILLFSYLSLFFAIPLYFFKEKLLFLFPFLYVSFEIILEHFLTGFPWGILANSQSSNTGLNYLFYISGVRGVSLFLVFSNVLIYHTLKEKKKRTFAFIVFLIILINIPGYFIKPKGSRILKVAVVQGNESMNTVWTGQRVKEEFIKYMNYTEKSVKKGAKLVIWPEFCFPYYPRYQSGITNVLKKFTKKNKVTLILGANDQKDGNYYNTAFVFHNGELDYYYKVHLTPFGEYIPYKNLFFFAKKIANVEGEFTPGKVVKVFDIDGVKVGVPICYEMVFPSLIKHFYDRGAELIVAITNDSWYGKTSGPSQLFYLSKVRAMEGFFPIARAATSGISGFFEQNGKILKKLNYGKEGYLVASLKIRDKNISPFYSLFYFYRYLILFFAFTYIFFILLKNRN